MVDKDFDTAINSIVKTLNAQTIILKSNTAALPPLTAALISLRTAVTANSTIVAASAIKLSRSGTGGRFVGPTRASLIDDSINNAQGTIAKIGVVLNNAAMTIRNKISMLVGSIGNIGSVISNIGPILGKFVKIVAIASGAIFAASRVVQLLNPGVVEVFNTALKDLGATIGVAFTPMIVVITRVVNQIASALLPVMQALAPVFEQLGRIIGDIIVPIIQVLADIMMALMPVFRVLATVIEIIASAFRIVIEIIGAVLTPILEAIALIFQILEPIIAFVADVFKVLASIISMVISALKALLRFVTFGLLGKETPKGGGAKAVSNEAPTIDAIAGLGNKIAQLAATAQPMNNRDTKAEGFLRRMADGIDAMTRGRGFQEGFTKALTKYNPFTNPSFTQGTGNAPKQNLNIGLGLIGGIGMAGILDTNKENK